MHVFLHIPKAAGSSLKRILRSQYEKATSFYIDGRNPSRSVQTLKDGADTYKELQLVHGHIDFGAVDFLSDDLSYVTLLRDPIDRIVSHYYFVAQHSEAYLHRKVIDNNISLKEYLLNGYSRELNDGIVRMIIGAGGHHKDEFSKYDIPYGETKEWMFEEALENIKQHFIFVGLQEKFDDSVFLMKKRLGWKRRLNVTKLNQSASRLQVCEIDESTLKVIKDYNELDIALYEAARSQFEQQLGRSRLYRTKEKVLLSAKEIGERRLNVRRAS